MSSVNLAEKIEDLEKEIKKLKDLIIFEQETKYGVQR